MKSVDPLPDPERDRLIALNASLALPRATACRFAAERAGGAAADGKQGELPGFSVLSAHAGRAARELGAEAGAIAARERAEAARHGATIVTCDDADYPPSFRPLSLPPPAIYVAGELDRRPAIAIVGARRASAYGLEVAAWFARSFAEAGVTVVSGFAVGVDAASHRAALEVEGGRTIAVLGSGLGVDYPRGHGALGRAIADHGALLTEFPCGRLPARWQFPARNRLIAALADACLVVEAAPQSGSLVTARWALDLGREVLAVPGRVVDELALGTNRLIADGARPALEPADVLEAIGFAPPSRQAPSTPPSGLGADATRLWSAARQAAASPEALAALAEIPIDRALATLLELELTGHLRRLIDGRYEIRR